MNNSHHIRRLTAAIGMGAFAMTTACAAHQATDPSPTHSTSSSAAAAGLCTKDDLKMRLRGGPDGAAYTVFPLVFVNTSNRPCVLKGIPDIAITGGDGSPAGTPARKDGVTGHVRPVTLAPGGVASAPVGQKPAKFVAGCDNFPASGYAVTLPGETEWTTIRKESTTCTGQPVLEIGPVRKGAHNTALPGHN